MNKINLTYIAVAALLALPSCNEEIMQTGGVDISDSRAITFQALLPQVSESRGEEAGAEKGIDYIQVTAFYPEGNLSGPYFENERFRKRSDSHYYPIKVTNCLWPETKGNMEFYAHYPEFDCFHYTGKYTVDTVRIANDISKQFDFMTAKGSTNIPEAGKKKHARPTSSVYSSCIS